MDKLSPMNAYLLILVVVLWLYGLPCGSAGKKSACNTGDLGLIPGLQSSQRIPEVPKAAGVA